MIVVLWGGVGQGRADQPPVVAAASDLQFALPELAELFAAQTAKTLRLSFGSSGNLRRQIAQGAPFQVFMSADEAYALALHREGFTRDTGVLYALGRIVLITPEDSPLAADGSLDDLARALRKGELRRFAIANPDHAPYGRAAREALQHVGLWEAIGPYLVLGENVSQAAQFATSGSSQGGIIAYSLALSPSVGRLGRHDPIPAEWHRPLRQRMVLLRGAGETAEAFYAFVQSPPARAVLRRYGFVLPGEEG